MQGIAKALLVSLMAAICIVLFINMIFFFPWYMTLISETYGLSQAAANDNYIKQSYYDDTLDRLRNRPIFRDKPWKITITVANSDNRNAVGYDDEDLYSSYDLHHDLKPYRQRGHPVTVTIEAVYPLSITLWGRKYEQELPASFSLTVVGLKHYKDLDL